MRLISWPIRWRPDGDRPAADDAAAIREANDLMEVSREQLELMRRQADQALEQAERMNELLARVVKLSEPLERAARGGEFVAEGLKRAILLQGKRPPRMRRGGRRGDGRASQKRSGEPSRRPASATAAAPARDPEHARVGASRSASARRPTRTSLATPACRSPAVAVSRKPPGVMAEGLEIFERCGRGSRGPAGWRFWSPWRRSSSGPAAPAVGTPRSRSRLRSRPRLPATWPSSASGSLRTWAPATPATRLTPPMI